MDSDAKVAQLLGLNLNMSKDIVIFTDASFFQQLKVGGWAAIIAYNAESIRCSGPLIDKESETNISAEVSAIFRSLDELKKQIINYKIDTNQTKVIINTDHLPIVNIFNGSNTKKIEKQAYWNVFKQKINEYQNSIDLPIIFQHIKAHTQCQSFEALCNKWCDKKAKENMHILISYMRRLHTSK
jgi:ribonuclease HI